MQHSARDVRGNASRLLAGVGVAALVFLVSLMFWLADSHAAASLSETGERLPDSSHHSLLLGVFLGYMLALSLSSLFLFATTRRSIFVVYFGYIVSIGITLGALHDLAFSYSGTQTSWTADKTLALFASMAMIFAILFTQKLFQVKRHSRALHNLCCYSVAVFAVNLMFVFFVSSRIQATLTLVLSVVAVIAIVGIGLWMSHRGLPLVRYYTLAWIILLVFGGVAALDKYNIIESPVSGHYLLMLGASIQTLVLAWVLAINYSQQRDDLLASQAQALAQEKAARLAKERLVEAQQEARDQLEYKVQERTLELEIALRELSEANRELELKNTLDALTGTKNRRFFDKRLLAESRRSRREQTPLSLVMIDIDHFKQVNDTHGHQAGDECLRHVANILKQQVKRPSDAVCRYGGEEFALILPNTDSAGAVALAETIRQALLENQPRFDGILIDLTLSAGSASCVIHYEGQQQELLGTADRSLYQAKQQGRNQVVADTIEQHIEVQEP